MAAGTPASEIAILYRTNGQSEAYEQALTAAGIGYLLRGGERFFARREVRDAMLQQIALGRLGEPADIAKAVAFLAGPSAAYITGETLHVNGGMYMA